MSWLLALLIGELSWKSTYLGYTFAVIGLRGFFLRRLDFGRVAAVMGLELGLEDKELYVVEIWMENAMNLMEF